MPPLQEEAEPLSCLSSGPVLPLFGCHLEGSYEPLTQKSPSLLLGVILFLVLIMFRCYAVYFFQSWLIVTEKENI